MKTILLTIKLQFLTNLLLVALAFLIPIKPLLLIVGLCIALDTIMGIWRAKKKKEKITSRKMSAVISKMVLYQSSIILFFIIEKFILADILLSFVSIPLLITKLVACTLIFIEIKSLNESVINIYNISLWDKFRELLSRAKDLKGHIDDVKK